VKLRKNSIELNKIKTRQLISELKNAEDIHVPPIIIFYALLTLFLVLVISAFGL
jgi:hypothetical protein